MAHDPSDGGRRSGGQQCPVCSKVYGRLNDHILSSTGAHHQAFVLQRSRQNQQRMSSRRRLETKSAKRQPPKKQPAAKRRTAGWCKLCRLPCASSEGVTCIGHRHNVWHTAYLPAVLSEGLDRKTFRGDCCIPQMWRVFVAPSLPHQQQPTPAQTISELTTLNADCSPLQRVSNATSLSRDAINTSASGTPALAASNPLLVGSSPTPAILSKFISTCNLMVATRRVDKRAYSPIHRRAWLAWLATELREILRAT